MNERENILARVREGLKIVAPFPGHGPEDAEPVSGVAPSQNARHWLPVVGNTFEARLELFRKNAADLRADFYLVNNLEELSMLLVDLRDFEGWKKIGIHSGDLTDHAAQALALPVCSTDHPYKVTDLETCDAGLTECDALIAQTGTVLVTSRSAGGRALSVLSPHHVVLARRDQLIADLPDAFSLLNKKYASDYPSFISFITGPSRTGDIERILVLGAHGPKKLSIFCL